MAGYCNEVFGYVPSQRVLQEGGYEARGAILYYGIIATPFAPSVEERIVDKVHELAARGNKPSSSAGGLVARAHNSGFAQAHDTYNGMGTGSDGKIYYVLSSESFEVGVQMFCYDPAADKIEHLGDITEACGEKDSRTIVQGKVARQLRGAGRQALFRDPRRLLQHHRWDGEDRHPAAGLEALSGRPFSGLRYGNPRSSRTWPRPRTARGFSR